MTYLHFDGVHHYSKMWLNGKQLGERHINGFTSMWHRLDSASGANFGDGDAGKNVLAIFANAAPGSGMYGDHGGGLLRHQRLVHTASSWIFLPPEETWVHTTFDPNTTITPNNGASLADGLAAAGNTTTVIVNGLISNTGAAPIADVYVTAEVMEGAAEAQVSGPPIGVATVGPLTIPRERQHQLRNPRKAPAASPALDCCPPAAPHSRGLRDRGQRNAGAHRRQNRSHIRGFEP